jgi:preprotein translocase subunit SecG
MLTTFLDIVHVFVCLFLMLVVLLQQGKGGGMGAAFGGGAAQQVFGGRGAGNLLTRATAICAGIFMLTSVSLAYLSSSGDRALRDKLQQEQKKGKGNEGAPRVDPSAKVTPTAAKSETPAGGGDTKPADVPSTPATAPSDNH